ncbi:hypothetical protein ACHAXS_003951 [Conticribra weissflogii]
MDFFSRRGTFVRPTMMKKKDVSGCACHWMITKSVGIKTNDSTVFVRILARSDRRLFNVIFIYILVARARSEADTNLTGSC